MICILNKREQYIYIFTQIMNIRAYYIYIYLLYSYMYIIDAKYINKTIGFLSTK